MFVPCLKKYSKVLIVTLTPFTIIKKKKLKNILLVNIGTKTIYRHLI